MFSQFKSLPAGSSGLKIQQEAAWNVVSLSMLCACYEIDRRIVEEEQNGRIFSATSLKQMRQFYQVYSQDQIGQTLSDEFEDLPSVSTGRSFFLSWSHYLKLMRISNADERHFYELMSVKHDWSLSELKRQYSSALYERLALSTDKDEVWRLAKEGTPKESPTDAIRDPYVLEFLGIKEQPSYSESELESRILDNLQQYLLGLGTGFSFMGRQVRFTFDEEHFMVDLVFYNRLLRCFVLFDLKIGKLTHQEIGQMMMYVHYYDRKVKLADENHTIGIMLCSDKNDAVVEMTLPRDNTRIFAGKYEYKTVLPSREALQRLLEEQVKDHAADNSPDSAADNPTANPADSADSRLTDNDGESQ